MEKIKKILKKTGDLRKVEKNDNKVRITDLFINGDGVLKMEQYSAFNISELEENEESVNHLLDWLKLWTIFDEENYSDLKIINDFLEGFDEDSEIITYAEAVTSCLKDDFSFKVFRVK